MTRVVLLAGVRYVEEILADHDVHTSITLVMTLLLCNDIARLLDSFKFSMKKFVFELASNPLVIWNKTELSLYQRIQDRIHLFTSKP